MDFAYKSGPRFLSSGTLFFLVGLIQLLTLSLDQQPFMQGLSLVAALGLFAVAGERVTRYWRSYVTIADGSITLDRTPLPARTFAIDEIDSVVCKEKTIELQLRDGKKKTLVHRPWLDHSSEQALEEELRRQLPAVTEEEKE